MTSAIGVAGDAFGLQSVLELENLSKRFGGVQALDCVSLTIAAGEVHGLLGENGSGKSTLIKVLAGFHAPDSGELRINGEVVPLPLHAGKFRELGIAFVHQDLGLIPSLTVLENLRIADFSVSGKYHWRIPWSRERQQARASFERYGLSLDPSALVSSLKPVERALLAIIRAVEEMRAEEAAYGRNGLLVLDEPTVFLPKADADQLFRTVRDIASGGDAVLFVSHDLDEVRDVTDKVTVLRDGRNAGTVITADATEIELVELIIGRRLATLVREHDRSDSDAAVHTSVRDLTGGVLESLSFDLCEGEVLGITGLMGSGFEEVPYFLFGDRKPQSGTMEIGGVTMALGELDPRRAVDLGIALVPADRQLDGAVGSLPIVDNVTLQVIDEFFDRFVLRRDRMNNKAAELMQTYDVRPPQPRLLYGSLSGGNQQKALLAKWMQIDPKLLLLHEPTQGVDIGAREQVMKLVRDAAHRGTSVICASSDYEQLSMVCDRVLVLGRGRIVQVLQGDDVTKERIAQQCYNSVDSEARIPVAL
jgi:ribose transport system ATP-binding protein